MSNSGVLDRDPSISSRGPSPMEVSIQDVGPVFSKFNLGFPPDRIRMSFGLTVESFLE